MTYDPSRLLHVPERYIPGRRRFLFLSGLAMAGTVIGRQPWAKPQYWEGRFGETTLWMHTRLLGRDGEALEWTAAFDHAHSEHARALELGARIMVTERSSPHIREFVVAEKQLTVGPRHSMDVTPATEAATETLQWWRLRA